MAQAATAGCNSRVEGATLVDAVWVLWDIATEASCTMVSLQMLQRHSAPISLGHANPDAFHLFLFQISFPTSA
jgi:hypothetical protein